MQCAFIYVVFGVSSIVLGVFFFSFLSGEIVALVRYRLCFLDWLLLGLRVLEEWIGGV